MSRNGRQRILVLGGGSGGLVAATHLGRALGEDHEVTLVDRRPNHVYMPGLLYLMVGERRREDLTRPLRRLEKRNVTVVEAEVREIDPERQRVTLDYGTLAYDELIISLGMQTRPDLIPGFAEAAHHAWELEAAEQLSRALELFEGGRILIGAPPGPYRCPPAPYEAQWLLDDYFRRRGIRERVEIEYFTPNPEPAGEWHDPAVWMDAESKRRGIEQHYEFAVERVDPERKEVRARFGYSLPFDLLLLVPPHRPAQVLLDCNLADSLNGLRVDYDTLATRWGNIYAIGDCADMPASKAGVVAHQEAEVVAHNLAVKLRGEGEPTTLRLHTI